MNLQDAFDAKQDTFERSARKPNCPERAKAAEVAAQEYQAALRDHELAKIDNGWNSV